MGHINNPVELFVNFTTTDGQVVEIPMPLEVRDFVGFVQNEDFEKYLVDMRKKIEAERNFSKI